MFNWLNEFEESAVLIPETQWPIQSYKLFLIALMNIMPNWPTAPLLIILIATSALVTTTVLENYSYGITLLLQNSQVLSCDHKCLVTPTNLPFQLPF
jgi:hypothetical protein